jgi:hypothetical protein
MALRNEACASCESLRAQLRVAHARIAYLENVHFGAWMQAQCESRDDEAAEDRAEQFLRGLWPNNEMMHETEVEEHAARAGFSLELLRRVAPFIGVEVEFPFFSPEARVWVWYTGEELEEMAKFEEMDE